MLLTLLTYIDAVLPGLSTGAAAFLQDWKGDIYGVVIVVVMLFAPSGLAGIARAVRARAGATAGESGLSGAGEAS